MLTTDVSRSLDMPDDKQLNDALNRLGLRLQEYVPVRQQPIDEKMIETSQLLEAHSNVIDRARVVLSAIRPPVIQHGLDGSWRVQEPFAR